MEDYIQRVFAILISVIIFFLLPLYMAFEKKDDISYALALKITTQFVDEVSNKGYIDANMYSEFIEQLGVTDNVYEVTFEHVAKKYYPVINTYENVVYTPSGPEYSDLKNEYFDFFQYRDNYNANIAAIKSATVDENGNSKVGDDGNLINGEAVNIQNTFEEKDTSINENKNLKLGYRLQEEKYYTDQILEVIGQNDEESSKYVMNQGDEFTVIIKNKNTTIASVLFNSLTFGANAENNIKVYINYGGTIKNMDWFEGQ